MTEVGRRVGQSNGQNKLANIIFFSRALGYQFLSKNITFSGEDFFGESEDVVF